MSGFGRFLQFANGEGVEFEDFDELQQLLRRTVIDELASYLFGDVDVTTGIGRTDDAALRPYRRALCPRVTGSSMVISFDPGPVLQHGVADDLDAAATEPENLFCYQKGHSVTLGAAHATLYRRDLVQARIIDVDESAISRDFEDSVTRAKTSSTVSKYGHTAMDISVKVGSDVATSNDADDPTNEPTPDAGYFKLCSVRVDAAASVLNQNTIWDWRKPAGYGGSVILPPHWMIDNTDSPIEAFTNPAAASILLAFTGSGQIARAWPMHTGGHPLTSASDAFGMWEDHRRLAASNLISRFAVSIGACKWQSYRPETGGTPEDRLDVATSVTIADTENKDQVYCALDFPGGGTREDRPMWANGRTSPAARGSGSGAGSGYNEFLSFLVTVGASGNRHIRSLHSHWWGGL